MNEEVCCRLWCCAELHQLLQIMVTIANLTPAVFWTWNFRTYSTRNGCLHFMKKKTKDLCRIKISLVKLLEGECFQSPCLHIWKSVSCFVPGSLVSQLASQQLHHQSPEFLSLGFKVKVCVLSCKYLHSPSSKYIDIIRTYHIIILFR